jgi:hypothetical protein
VSDFNMDVTSSDTMDGKTALEGLLNGKSGKQRQEILQYIIAKGMSEDSEALLMVWTLEASNTYVSELVKCFHALDDRITSLKAAFDRNRQGLTDNFNHQKMELDATIDAHVKFMNQCSTEMTMTLGGFQQIEPRLQKFEGVMQRSEGLLTKLKELGVAISSNTMASFEHAMRRASDEYLDNVRATLLERTQTIVADCADAAATTAIRVLRFERGVSVAAIMLLSILLIWRW